MHFSLPSGQSEHELSGCGWPAAGEWLRPHFLSPSRLWLITGLISFSVRPDILVRQASFEYPVHDCVWPSREEKGSKKEMRKRKASFVVQASISLEDWLLMFNV